MHDAADAVEPAVERILARRAHLSFGQRLRIASGTVDHTEASFSLRIDGSEIQKSILIVMIGMEEMADLVSVVIPAHNAARTIGETIDSVISQSYRTMEVIVVDDGSTDDTVAIVRRRMADTPSLRLVTQTNQGVSAARNAGIRAARGAFIAFIDADDLWHRDKIALQVARLRRDGNRLGIVYTWSTYMSLDGHILPGRAFAETYEGDVYAPLLTCNFMNGTLMVRRQCLERVGLYDTALRVNEDLKMHLALARYYDFGVVPRFLSGYRLQTTGLSHDIRRLRMAQGQVRDEVRRQNPHLPGWLFRWSEGNNLWNLGARALRAHRYVEGLQLLMLTFVRDPGFLFQPAVRAALRAVVRRGLGRVIAARKRHDRYHFLDPRAEASIVPPTSSFSHARRKRLASLQARALAAMADGTPRREFALVFKTLLAALHFLR
jgi:glycosyltransferase involved in cell wall biosynthesis